MYFARLHGRSLRMKLRFFKVDSCREGTRARAKKPPFSREGSCRGNQKMPAKRLRWLQNKATFVLNRFEDLNNVPKRGVWKHTQWAVQQMEVSGGLHWVIVSIWAIRLSWIHNFGKSWVWGCPGVLGFGRHSNGYMTGSWFPTASMW